ncbi:hypothetical protein HYH02_003641 [Chlamydomonas schloesseri]|uniref:Nucleoside diphosphate kinase 6 n=1 Tax=Chlamydomonas schloesseri TaxID=2026947 RepID=A0A836BA30_9CHLO|nr:hypothetical protein HYH02_003641 [Chlamydomonas schloesseri]|eukprot:KAG2451865.1 hypothetical protein HYH02_003641 [Chlamydomonas schloesseri]
MAELEKTFALIKPDAVRAGKAQEIMQLIELNGFTIIAKQKLQLTRARAEEFYGEHKGKEFFPKLVNFMTSGPIWALVLAKPGAILAWRALMGPTNVFKARAEQPKCLRALYGTDGTQNATHGSDSPISAAREIKFFFPTLSGDPTIYAEPAAAAEYITKRIQPALAKALAALAREKPSADKFEAITFVAGYLLQNNPNKPKVLMPDEWDPALMGDDEDDEADFINARLAGPTGNDRASKADFDAMVAAAKADTGGAAAAPPQEFVYPDSKPTAAAVPVPPAPGSKPASASSARPPSARPMSARPPSASAAPLAPAPPPASSSRPASGSGRPPSATARPPSATPLPPPPAAELEEEDPALLDEAATKVQAAFRGYQARKEVAVMRSESQPGAAEDEPAGAPAAEAEPQPQASASGIPLPDGVTEEMAAEAAILVQAHMRGHLARRQVAAIKAQQTTAVAESSEAPAPEAEPEPQPEASVGEPQPKASASGIPLPDGVTEEMAAEAATLVQAHMRGHLARRQVAAIKAQQISAAAESSEAPQAEAEPEPEAGAAEGEAEPEPEAAE